MLSCPSFMALVTWVNFLGDTLKATIPLHTRTYTHTVSLTHTCAHRCAFVCLYVDVVMYVFVFGFRKVNPGSTDPMFSKHSIFILDTGESQHIISFDGRAWSLTGNSPTVSCEKGCLGASDEGIYEWVRVRRLIVANSRHLVLATIKTPKNSYKIPTSAVSGTLLMSGFQIFAPDAAF